MGLCVVSVLSVMILCCGLVSLCLCVYDLKLLGACAAVPVLHCVRLALCVVLSLGHILLTVAAACVNRV